MLKMKSTSKLNVKNMNKSLNTESKAKIYVPISNTNTNMEH